MAGNMIPENQSDSMKTFARKHTGYRDRVSIPRKPGCGFVNVSFFFFKVGSGLITPDGPQVSMECVKGGSQRAEALGGRVLTCNNHPESVLGCIA